MTRFTARTGGTHPRHEIPPAVQAAHDLHALADLWPRLTAALHPGATPTSGGRVTGTHAHPSPINLNASTTIADIEGWIYAWARILANETNWTPPDTGIDTTTTYRPPTTGTRFDPALFGRGELNRYLAAITRPVRRLDAPTVARALADRAGHFTHHPDGTIAAAFPAECYERRRQAEDVVWPTGARWVPTKVGCLDHGTDDRGRRVPCTGEYRVLLVPDADRLGDMVCGADGTHRVTPAEWQRLERRVSADPAAARAFLERIRGAA